jgi:hypothetical protein
MNTKFTFTYKFTDENGKEVTNTLETNHITLDDICERFAEFLLGCGFKLDRVEAIINDTQEAKRKCDCDFVGCQGC